FVGADNFIKIITDPDYIKVFLNSFYYFVSGILQMVVSLYFAILLSEKVKFKSFFKATIFFPTLISGVAISMMFRMFYSPDGTFNELLSIFGLEEHIKFWIGDPKVVNYTLASISLWRYTGFSFIMYLGAIASIPKEYKKVAQLEGASFIQQIRYVILPNIQTVIKLNFILITIAAISAFEIPMIMTNGSNGTSTFLLQTMKTAFEKRMFGLASSMAVILAIAIGILLILQNKIYRNDKDGY
ncbi:sugar ABC transporter permease, partial [Romboutsia weinsteinii]